MRFQRVVFDPHCHKHGLTEEDIVYAAENLTSPIEQIKYNGNLYIRFIGKHTDALIPQIEVVLKVTATRIVIIYHANAASTNFFDTPFAKWITKYHNNK